jgi:hypothetical protein
MTDQEIQAAVQEALDALKRKGYEKGEVCVDFMATARPYHSGPRWGAVIYGESYTERLHMSSHPTAAGAIAAIDTALVGIPAKWTKAAVGATLGLHPDGSLIEETAYAVAAE